MNVDFTDLLRASPWILIPLLALWRSRGSRSLDEFPAQPPRNVPPVSIIVPARDEARNIGRCVTSLLAADYPALEVIVVDDHSTDDTADVARRAAGDDARLRVLANDPLPPDWFGKQWACATGARHARGALLLFADADTMHAPDLLPRLVAAQREFSADLISIAGRQELGTFWERVIQPQVFAILFMRFGGTEGVNRARHPSDVIANGQCLMMTREAYAAVGGHASVRDTVAEDLMLAQETLRRGLRVRLVLGVQQLATRMYTSLDELLAGWGKNVYAGGIHAMPFGRTGRILFPVLFLLAPAMALLPPVVLLLSVAGIVSASHLAWAAIASLAMLAWWVAVYAAIDEPIGYALAYPLGAVMLGYIFVRAMARGRRVSWKGREYVAPR